MHLFDWVVGSGCALHDAHNALTWSLHTQFKDLELMKDVYIIISSVMNSYDLVHGHLAAWLNEHMHFVPADALPHSDQLFSLWTALGVEPELADVLSSDLRLRWEGGRLDVAEVCSAGDNVFGNVAEALFGLWKFKTFSTSRWVSVGTSCRSFVAALLTGFDSLVRRIRADPKASDFFLHGYSEMREAARQFMATAGLVSYVPEGFLLDLMGDSRVCMRVEALRDALREDISFLWVDGHVCLPADRQRLRLGR